MNKASVTYTFDENEVGYAIWDGKVVASHHDIDELERLAHIEIEEAAKKPKRQSNRVIVNPSGLKGTVLGKEQSLWGEEVSIRFENGEIRRIAAVFVEPDNETVEKTASAPVSFVDRLNTRLAATYTHTPDSLLKRRDELEEIRKEARALLSGKPTFEEERELHSIVVTAENEQAEIDSALDHIAEENTHNEFKPPRHQAIEQGSLGGGNSTWLDHTIQDMIDEGKSTDYEKLLSEGPALFTNELDTGTLADASATQAVAASFVQSKVAMLQDEVAKDFERTFLARTEEARRDEYKHRMANIKKEAVNKKRDLDNVPDDGLFL